MDYQDLIALPKRFVNRHGVSPGDAFLKRVDGVIHVGANTGQERALYATLGLDVVWIEPVQSVFQQLCSNLAGFPRQRAFRHLVTDQDDCEYVFHVASNQGASSSILPLAEHQSMWPEIFYIEDIVLTSVRLPSLVTKEDLDLTKYQALVLDTQGSELMILKGAAGILPSFRFVKVEVPDFESYQGCCLLSELNNFMESHGFRECRRDPFESAPGLGTYFDVLYERTGRPRACAAHYLSSQ